MLRPAVQTRYAATGPVLVAAAHVGLSVLTSEPVSRLGEIKASPLSREAGWSKRFNGCIGGGRNGE